jgi:hypothetical protein
MPTLVPGGELAPNPGTRDVAFYHDKAREICRRVQNKAHLTDDEIIVLAMVAAQLALDEYIEPGARDSDDTLHQILSIIDRDEVNAAISSKLDRLLEGPRSAAREDAPSGRELRVMDLCKDPNEPAGS